MVVRKKYILATFQSEFQFELEFEMKEKEKEKEMNSCDLDTYQCCCGSITKSKKNNMFVNKYIEFINGERKRTQEKFSSDTNNKNNKSNCKQLI